MFGLGLERYLTEFIYAAGVISVLLSLLWKPAIGIFYLIPLLPMQTLRYRLIHLPLGESVVGVVLLSVVAGLVIRGQLRGPKGGIGAVLAVYSIYTLFSLFIGAIYLGVSLPIYFSDPRLKEWLNYMFMPLLLVASAVAIRTRFEMWIVIGLMLFAGFGMNFNLRDTMSNRDMSTYSEGLAEAGAMGMAGSNGLAAFEAQFAVFLLAFAGIIKRIYVKIGLLALVGLTIYCLMYSFSRGGYVAFVVGCIFLGLLRHRALLVGFIVCLMFWSVLVPPAVRQRVEMTYDGGGGSLDSSSETRLSLWTDALAMAKKHPVLGTGYYTYAYMNRIRSGAGHTYSDTHNYFVKVLLETGFIGLILFLFMFWRIFQAGYGLYRKAGDDELFAALGLGLAVWAVASAVANLFGDRWSFLQVNAYMWILVGLVCRAHQMLAPAVAAEPATETPEEAIQIDSAITA
jgi:O-antigen ligase